MDIAQIIDRLGDLETLPVEAIAAARAERAAAVPEFIKAIEQCSRAGEDGERNSALCIFHLLGEWREKSAYRPLARLLRRWAPISKTCSAI